MKIFCSFFRFSKQEEDYLVFRETEFSQQFPLPVSL